MINSIPQISCACWDAKQCILEMREVEYRNWKQTEWIGFYFEYLAEKHLIPGVAQFKLFVGNTSFNGCAGKNIVDYKTSSANQSVILNDKNAIDRVVNEYRELGYIIIVGDIEKEQANELDVWRKGLTGRSVYVIKGELTGRRHRKLKSKFYPKSLLYASITKQNIKSLSIFHQGVNSDGNPRNPKYILPKNKMGAFILESICLKGYSENIK